MTQQELQRRLNQPYSTENWKEIVALLMMHTKKNIEAKINNNNKYILDSQDITISKLIVDTLKVIGQEKFSRNENQEQISYKGKDINFFKTILEDESRKKRRTR